MTFRPLFVFDLDNTLYPPDVALWRIVDGRIEAYVRERLGVGAAEARRVREEFLREFGTTLRGLMERHGIAPGEYLKYVHDVPIPEIVPPRPELGAMLSRLPGRRVVFTNGSAEYARRVVDALAVGPHIDGIFGIEFMEYVAKPSSYPYRKLLRTTGTPAAEALFCEDRLENLLPARELGMFTVWVGGREGGPPGSARPGGPDGRAAADAVVADVCELPRVIPRFLANGRGPATLPGREEKDGGDG